MVISLTRWAGSDFVQGQSQEALPYLEKASEKVKYDPIIADHLGDALVASGKKKGSIRSISKIAPVEPRQLAGSGEISEIREGNSGRG